jgi:type IV pilus assembly protein PilM
MKIPFLGGGGSVVGIDVGHRTVKGISLTKRGKKIFLERYFFTDLASVFPRFPDERDPEQVLTAMIQIHKLAGAHTATAIPDEQVFNFELSLPQMPKGELAQAVQFEVSNLSRIPESELVVDFWDESIGPVQKGGSLRLRAFASRMEHVNQHLVQLKKAGFKPDSVESAMLANIEALRHNGYIQPTTQCAIVDLGDSETVTAFVRQGALHYCRSEKTGGGSMNEALKGRLAITYADADKTKMEYRFSESMADSGAQEALEGVYFRIFKSIKDSIEGYIENTPGARLEAIYLVGGGSRAPKIDEVIQGFFGIPAILANPFKNIELYPNSKAARDDQIAKLAPQLTTAVGLALRGVT